MQNRAPNHVDPNNSVPNIAIRIEEADSYDPFNPAVWLFFLDQRWGLGPTGRGLFAFNMMDDILAAFDAINTNYERHSRAARAIAHEYFKAETVLAKLLVDLGL